MSDRELLEMAAKAAGYDCRWHPDDPFSLRHMHIAPNWIAWNPLDDDGDSLRLAVILKMELAIFSKECHTRCIDERNKEWFVVECDDPYAATRRAIVRAAAEIGKAMK